jgi:hypothetical protein
MRRRSLAVLASALVVCAVPTAARSAAGGDLPTGPFAVAVYGDAPYGTSPTDTAQLAATPAFIASVNADPEVSSVIHVGDIHSGKQYCTKAYDMAVAKLWRHYADPLVYTPGDNEWADCHKVAEGGGAYNATTARIDYVVDPKTGHPVDYARGNPAANLDLVRSIFFPEPGQTLGGGGLRVLSQAQIRDPAHTSDRQFVENVLWETYGIVFVTMNVPGGSNNDADPWYGGPITSQQQDEAALRTAADLRWLDRAFALAGQDDADGVVVIEQSDMWDLDGKPATHLANYEPIVASLASHTAELGKPVLLFEGDSHIYRSDNPLQQAAPCAGDGGVCAYDAWNSHPGYDVANFRRVVVHGSTTPLEWLKLTVTPGSDHPTTDTSFGPFAWERMTQS